jgi:hypothetical protein
VTAIIANVTAKPVVEAMDAVDTGNAVKADIAMEMGDRHQQNVKRFVSYN